MERIARWIILLQKIVLEIIHRADIKHRNVEFLSRMEMEVEVISEDNDFPDTKLISIDIDKGPAEYKDIKRYLKALNFPDGATKQIRTKIAYKNRSYTLIG